MAKITSIGGVFLKTKRDRNEIAYCYQTHSGVTPEKFDSIIVLDH